MISYTNNIPAEFLILLQGIKRNFSFSSFRATILSSSIAMCSLCRRAEFTIFLYSYNLTNKFNCPERTPSKNATLLEKKERFFWIPSWLSPHCCYIMYTFRITSQESTHTHTVDIIIIHVHISLSWILTIEYTYLFTYLTSRISWDFFF